MNWIDCGEERPLMEKLLSQDAHKTTVSQRCMMQKDNENGTPNTKLLTIERIIHEHCNIQKNKK